MAAISLDIGHMNRENPIVVTLDGQDIGPVNWPPSHESEIVLVRRDDNWHHVATLPKTEKSPRRHGSWKSVFDRRVVLVYGTQGDDSENA